MWDLIFRCLIHNFCKTTYMVASLQKFLRIFLQQHLAIFDHDHFFHQVCCFLDNMCGNNEGTSGLCIFLHQFMVKIITHYNIKATEGYERHHEEKMGRSKSVTILLEEGQKLPEGYDVTIQALNLEKLFVSLCGMEE